MTNARFSEKLPHDQLAQAGQAPLMSQVETDGYTHRVMAEKYGKPSKNQFQDQQNLLVRQEMGIGSDILDEQLRQAQAEIDASKILADPENFKLGREIIAKLGINLVGTPTQQLNLIKFYDQLVRAILGFNSAQQVGDANEKIADGVQQIAQETNDDWAFALLRSNLFNNPKFIELVQAGEFDEAVKFATDKAEELLALTLGATGNEELVQSVASALQRPIDGEKNTTGRRFLFPEEQINRLPRLVAMIVLVALVCLGISAILPKAAVAQGSATPQPVALGGEQDARSGGDPETTPTATTTSTATQRANPTATTTASQRGPGLPTPTATAQITSTAGITATATSIELQTPTETPENEAKKTVEITGDTVNIRSGPGTGNSVIGSAKAGETYEFIESNAGWYQIKLKDDKDDKTGWVSAQFSKIIEPEPETAPPQQEVATATPTPEPEKIATGGVITGTETTSDQPVSLSASETIQTNGKLRFFEGFPYYQEVEAQIVTPKNGKFLSLHQTPGGNILSEYSKLEFAINTGKEKDGFLQVKIQVLNTDGTFKDHYAWIEPTEVNLINETLELANYKPLNLELGVLASNDSLLQSYDDQIPIDKLKEAYDQHATNLIIELLTTLKPKGEKFNSIDWTNSDQIRLLLTKIDELIITIPLPVRYAYDESGEPISNWGLSKVDKQVEVDLKKGISFFIADKAVWDKWKNNPVLALSSEDENVRKFAEVCEGLTPEMFILDGSTPSEFSTDSGSGGIVIVKNGQLTAISFKESSTWHKDRLQKGQQPALLLFELNDEFARLIKTSEGMRDGDLSAQSMTMLLADGFNSQILRLLSPLGVKK